MKKHKLKHVNIIILIQFILLAAFGVELLKLEQRNDKMQLQINENANINEKVIELEKRLDEKQVIIDDLTEQLKDFEAN